MNFKKVLYSLSITLFIANIANAEEIKNNSQQEYVEENNKSYDNELSDEKTYTDDIIENSSNSSDEEIKETSESKKFSFKEILEFTFENFGIVLGITPIQTGGTPVYVTNFIRYALPNTLIITFVTVPISIILALFIAILINSIKVLRGLFQTIFFEFSVECTF